MYVKFTGKQVICYDFGLFWTETQQQGTKSRGRILLHLQLHIKITDYIYYIPFWNSENFFSDQKRMCEVVSTLIGF